MISYLRFEVGIDMSLEKGFHSLAQVSASRKVGVDEEVG